MPRGKKKSFPPSAPLLCFSPYIRLCVQFTFLHFLICTFAHLHSPALKPAPIYSAGALSWEILSKSNRSSSSRSKNPTHIHLQAIFGNRDLVFFMKSEMSAEFLRYLCNPRRNQFWQAGVNSQTSPTPKVSRQCVFVLLLRYCSDGVRQ